MGQIVQLSLTHPFKKVRIQVIVPVAQWIEQCSSKALM